MLNTVTPPKAGTLLWQTWLLSGHKKKNASVTLRPCSTVTANHKQENVATSSLSMTLMDEERRNIGCVIEDEDDE